MKQDKEIKEIWIYKFENGGTEYYFNQRPQYKVADTKSETRYVYEGEVIKLGIDNELLKRDLNLIIEAIDELSCQCTDRVCSCGIKNVRKLLTKLGVKK